MSVQLGLQSLKKAGREHSMRHFVEDAALILPTLSHQFHQVAVRKFHVRFDSGMAESQRQFKDFLTTEDSMDE